MERKVCFNSSDDRPQKERKQEIQTFRPDERTIQRNPNHHTWSPDLSLGNITQISQMRYLKRTDINRKQENNN